MDLVTELLAAVLTGLAFLLTAIGGAAASRYRDPRLALVAAGLAVIGTVGALSILHEVSPRYGSSFGIAAAPLALLVVAVGLLYLALVRGGPRRPGA